MGRGAWQATAHGVTKSRTQLSMHTHMCIFNICTFSFVAQGEFYSLHILLTNVVGISPDCLLFPCALTASPDAVASPLTPP